MPFVNKTILKKIKYAKTYDNSKYSPNQFHGYSRMQGLKEQYMIRAPGLNAHLYFPGSYPINNTQSPHFGFTSLVLYEQLDQTCRYCLYEVSKHLNIDSARVNHILDPLYRVHEKIDLKNDKYVNFESYRNTQVTTQVNVDGIAECTTNYMIPSYVSSSLLDVFRYGNKFEEDHEADNKFKNNHLSHSDSGILTLVPCADVAGLEVCDQQLEQWLGIEQMIHAHMDNHRNYGTIFWGDSFEYLCKKDAEACMHRVGRSNVERFSIVFKQRTCPTTTAPRYQEDYELGFLQLKALDAQHLKQK